MKGWRCFLSWISLRGVAVFHFNWFATGDLINTFRLNNILLDNIEIVFSKPTKSLLNSIYGSFHLLQLLRSLCIIILGKTLIFASKLPLELFAVIRHHKDSEANGKTDPYFVQNCSKYCENMTSLASQYWLPTFDFWQHRRSSSTILGIRLSLEKLFFTKINDALRVF